MFRWSCFALAAVSIATTLWMVNDLRVEMRRTTGMLNERLPQILERTKQSTETLAELSTDLRQLRDLAGATAPRDKTLVAYADAVLDAIERSPGVIGLEKTMGSGLKDEMPAKDWVTSARREAVWLSMTTKSKSDLLRHLCKNKFGSNWMIRVGDKKPEELEEWVQTNVKSAGE